jgi:SAM-dependent methyltransferase
VKKTAQGLASVVHNWGGGYFGHVLRGVAWPSAAYRFGWGASAPPLMQAAFAAAGELAGSKPEKAELQQLGLLAGPENQPVTNLPASEIEQLMERAHLAGITGVSASFRALARTPGGALVFAELRNARRHRLGSLHFAAGRDVDRCAFNRDFGASLLTEATARASLQEITAQVSEGSRDYPQIDFGCGLTTGEVASTDSSTGRSAEVNRHVVAPLVAARRVLDLGANNGALSLMMLRAGAREVVAVERSPELAHFARLNARILSWRDVRPYAIEILTGDMRLFLTADLGEFDVVTAFCSLYYLPEEDMARIVTKAAAMNAVLILQANEAIDDLPAKTLDLHQLMRENGYPEIEVHTPGGFARPVLVGHTRAGAGARRRNLSRTLPSTSL